MNTYPNDEWMALAQLNGTNEVFFEQLFDKWDEKIYVLII